MPCRIAPDFAISHTTPIIASMILYLQPVFGFVWAAILLGEKITPEFIAGAILAFVGVALVTNFGRLVAKEENQNSHSCTPNTTHRGAQ